MNRALVIAPLVVLSATLGAQSVSSDASPHTQRFVNVGGGVRLEVLDWGGTGQPLVLLAGRGNNAHVFDVFAPKLSGEYRVLGITRRGFGNSTMTTSGFLSDSLGDDVLAVLDSLRIMKPVLIGHSIAGQELSSIGSRHPERVAGLVYLDAGAHFAFYNSTGGRAPAFFRDTQRKLARLMDPAVGMTLAERGVLVAELQERMPTLERHLAQWRQELAEIPEQSRVLPAPETNAVFRAMALGQQVYTTVNAPVLAFFALPSQPSARIAADSAARAYFFERRAAELSRIAAFERGMRARTVILADADHYVFRSNEADVLRGIRQFLSDLSYGVAWNQPAVCRRQEAAAMAYVVDGKPSTCGSALSIERGRIASVEVLKGAAATAYLLRPGADGLGVVVIQTKPTP
jgi:non-heme chloroperoxidase